MAYYELAKLGTALFGAAKAAPGIAAYTSDPAAKGTLLGAWASDIGALNDVYVLRRFECHADLLSERERARRSSNPFGCSEVLNRLEMWSYAPLDGLPEPEPGTYGPFYELRSYEMKTAGLVPTIAAWQDAIPKRDAYSPLLLAMYSIDGPPLLTQFWPYATLEERGKARAQSVADGAWPPKGGPDWLTTTMTSTICMPLAISPLK